MALDIGLTAGTLDVGGGWSLHRFTLEFTQIYEGDGKKTEER